MRVAIDARALMGEQTGIGTYTRGIARALAARPGLTVGLFSPRPLPDPPRAARLSAHEGPDLPGLLWTQTAFAGRAARWGADALLAALTIAPVVTSLPVVSVVHDLTPVTHPEWHAARTLIGFLPFWGRTARRAARFVCVSEATASELVRLYPDTRGRLRVALNGVDPEFCPGGTEALRVSVRARFSAGRPFLLFLGTLEPRKNIAALVTACEQLWQERRDRPDLVLAGAAGWKARPLLERIRASRFRDKIHLAGYAARQEALELYRCAEAFVYPSFEEGFGLPLAEAMACGTPCVVSTAQALVEVGGDAALYAAPEDPQALSCAIAAALENPATRRRLAWAGPRRAAAFTWEAAAAATALALEEAAAS
ncbi:MAG: glycosyltransferase family 4 protein [Thermoanaerobaculia bacterium]